MLLRAIDGVYLGMLLLTLEVAAPPADEVFEGIVGAGMAPLVDRLAPALQFVSMHSPRLPAAALDQVHGWMPLTADGLPAPALLDAVTDVLSRTDRPARFRWCDRDGDRRGRRSRLQPLAVELFPSSSSTCRAVMIWRQEPLPYGLTRRELDVLAAMVTGASNAAIAQELSTGVRTITTHVEHILAKLSVTTRTATALLANRDGLLSIGRKYVI